MLFVTGAQFLQFPSPLSNCGQIPYIPQMPKSQSLSVKASKAKKPLYSFSTKYHTCFSGNWGALGIFRVERNTASAQFPDGSFCTCSLILKRISRDTRSLLLTLNMPVVQSIIATTNIVNAMGNWWCTVTFFQCLFRLMFQLVQSFSLIKQITNTFPDKKNPTTTTKLN